MSSVHISVCLIILSAIARGEAITGPETEKRFPKLVIPDGFHATLFACDPLVEYPSVISIGPEQGTLFVAHDYTTGLGVEIVRRDEIRLLRDRDHDGYADESVVYAEGFNSIQGLAYHAGVVYVMHAPLLSSLRDTDGDGKADDRRDLIKGLGLPPEENDNRLHCANGVVVGHDGWLYLALGDRGADVQRPEGDRLLFQEGGILRCRSDGRDLHVFSRGLRNIYDLALDDDLNVFIRDNENDGGDYLLRVYHCFHGSDHGYPYLYRERPEEAVTPLAILGRGSSAGAVIYRETAFPPEYRGNLFCCEWGRAVVRYKLQPAGGGFAPVQEIDFAAAAPDDPYGFKPTDVVVDRDGSLLISDWGDEQRPKRGRGRIYRIDRHRHQLGGSELHKPKEAPEYAAIDTLLKQLNWDRAHIRVAAQERLQSRGHIVRPLLEAIEQKRLGTLGRLHAVWVLAHQTSEDGIEHLMKLAATDSEPRVRAQAIRAIADLTDPVLTKHQLDAGRGDEALCRRLAELGKDQDARVRREVMIALGRLHWNDAPEWLAQQDKGTDPVLSHAAMQLLRRSDHWPAVLELLDQSPMPIRIIALRALADQADEIIVDGLIAKEKVERNPARRIDDLDWLARVYQKPAAWTYWGFRPAPRPGNPVAWERTAAIAETLDRALADRDVTIRAAVVQRMLREGVPIAFERLTRWLAEDTSADGVAAILTAFAARSAAEVRPALEQIVGSQAHVNSNRLAALTMLMKDLDAEAEARLRKSADGLDEGPVLAAVISELAKRPAANISALAINKLASQDDDVRAAAAESLVLRTVPEAASQVVALLGDREPRVRRAAATLAGKLLVKEAAQELLVGATNFDAPLRRASLEGLLLLEIPQAVEAALQSLNQPETQVVGLAYLGRFGGPQHVAAVLEVAEQSRATDVLIAAVAALRTWHDRLQTSAAERMFLQKAIAGIQGKCGLPIAWHVRGPISADVAKSLIPEVGSDPLDANTWARKEVQGSDALLRLEAPAGTESSVWLAATDLKLEAATEVEVVVTTSKSFQLYLNGRALKAQERTASNTQPPHRFETAFSAGPNRLLLEIIGGPAAEFHLHFRAKSSKAAHERLVKLVLDGKGSIERGQSLFSNAEKSQCIKCHRLGEQGGRIGPDLTGVGSRISRVHLVESLLEPSRTIAPSYGTWTVALSSGQVVTGVKSSETATQLILGDNQGKLMELLKSDIEEMQPQAKSTMPEGLEQRLTDREFLDLVEFLLSQKKR